VYPLGLACIAASIPEHEVTVYDPNTVAAPLDGLKEIIARCSPELVGVSLRNIDSTNKSEIVFYYQWVGSLLAIISSNCDAKIVLGGSGFSMFAKEIMEEHPAIDYGVYLEGESVFPLLLQHLAAPFKVPSLFYRQGGKICYSGDGQAVEINQAPPPAWDALACAPYLKGRDAIGVETKRGCALGCVYCIYGFLNGRKYRLKSPVRVVDEVEALVKKHKVTQFTFVDSIFNVPQAHAREICRELITRNISVTWSAWLNEHFFDHEFLTLLVEAGCRHIIFSPDGFSNGVLRILGKNLSMQDIVQSLLLVQRNTNREVELSYNFFMNPPGQSLANFFGMLFFCLLAKVTMKKRVHFEFSVMRIEPHTGLYRIALEEGVITKNQCLLNPTYYSNRRTQYLERMMKVLLSLRGKLSHANR